MDRKVLAVIVVALLVVSGLSVLLFFSQGRGGAPAVDDRLTVRAWIDLAAIPGGAVRGEDRWGSVETFAGAASGTLTYYNQVSLHQTAATESVVLGGEVWCMMRSNVSNAVLARYTPEVRGQGWNISFECYAPQAGDARDAAQGVLQIGLTATLIDRQGSALASVDLSYGTPGSNYVRLRDPGTEITTQLSDVMIPSLTVRGPTEGFAPERYLVSFQHAEGGNCTVTVLHTSGAMVGQGWVSIPPNWGGPAQLMLSTSSTVLVTQSPDPSVPWMMDTHSGGWFVDNLACRGATAPYPLAGPLYEYASEGASAPDRTFAGAHAGAEVTIGGIAAEFNGTTGRYEANLKTGVQWGRSVPYTVTLDGVVLSDAVALTVASSAGNARVSEWWNGWDWVSVFGLDDCAGPDSALATYSGYEHPRTAYIMYATGSSSQAMTYPYLEIALHYPHDWQGGAVKFWKDAASQAAEGVQFLKGNFTYASRWDAPSNGGQGDTYISMANPGNKATYQQLYALYQAGIRIDGRSSDIIAGSPGNHTQLGSWYDPGGYQGSGAGWQPYRPIDLMDAARLLSWDGERSWSSAFDLVSSVAENHGVLRVYGHPNRAIAIPALLHWIDDPKTNYSLENWKATDGEVASYIYGRWSTGLSFDAGSSDASTWAYNVSRADPTEAGYWKVPVTIAIDLEGKKVKDITVKDGGRTLRSSTGTLDNLDGARIMDSGFDIRDGVLYISSMWEGGAKITVTFETSSLVLDLTPSTPMIMRAD